MEEPGKDEWVLCVGNAGSTHRKPSLLLPSFVYATCGSTYRGQGTLKDEIASAPFIVEALRHHVRLVLAALLRRSRGQHEGMGRGGAAGHEAEEQEVVGGGDLHRRV